MPNLKNKRSARAKKTRILIANSGNIRLSIHRSNSHIYAQLIDDKNSKTVTSASSLELKNEGKRTPAVMLPVRLSSVEKSQKKLRNLEFLR